MKQLPVQRGAFAFESAIRIVFNKKQTRGPPRQMEEFLSQDYSCREFDDNVGVVTELQALACLGCCGGAARRGVPKE